MAVKLPPTATAILATPIDNVEESRAQRLQRQQSRFRDRGGIFIPSSRNTLADILLGKVSPIKKPRRSASLSPSKDRRKLNNEKPKSLVGETSAHEQNLRRSPRKQGRISSVSSLTGGSKPISKVSSHSTSKALAYSPKPSSVTRKTPTNASDGVDADPALVKGPNGKKTPASRRAKESNSSDATAQRPKKKDAQNQEKGPRPKGTRTNATADLMNGNANLLKPSESVASSSASAKTRNPKKTSHNIPSDDEEYDEGTASKTGRNNSGAAKSQPSSSNRKSSSKPSVPSKPSKSRAGVPQLPDIMEEEEDDALSPSRLSSPNNTSTKIRHEATTTKKRQAIDEDPSTHPDNRPRKRAKPARKDTAVKQSKAKTRPKPQIASDEEPSPVQRKRRRVVEQDGDAYADVKVGKPAKRKKVVSENEMVDKSPLKLKKSVAKPRSKSAPKARKPTAKKAPTKTAKRKENSVAPQTTQLEAPQASVLPRRGPPKSILLRLQNSSAPHVVDDEPDPIDFLS